MTTPYPEYWTPTLAIVAAVYALLFIGSFFMSLSNLKSHRWMARAYRWTYVSNIGAFVAVIATTGNLVFGREKMPCILTLGTLYLFPVIVIGPIIVRFYIYYSIVRMLDKEQHARASMGREANMQATLMSHYLYMKTKTRVNTVTVTVLYLLAVLAHVAYLAYILLQVSENHPELQQGCRLDARHFAMAGLIDLCYFAVAALFMFVLFRRLKTDKSTGFDVGLELMLVLVVIILCGLPVIIVNLRFYDVVERIFPIELFIIIMAYGITTITLLIPTIFINLRSSEGVATQVDLTMFDTRDRDDDAETLEMASLMMVRTLPDVRTVLSFPHHVSNMCMFVSRNSAGKPISLSAGEDQKRKSPILAAAHLIRLLDMDEVTKYAWEGFANVRLAVNNGQNILWCLDDMDIKDGMSRKRVVDSIFCEGQHNGDALVRSELQAMLNCCCAYIKSQYLPKYMESSYFMTAMEAGQQDKPLGFQQQKEMDTIVFDDGDGIQ